MLNDPEQDKYLYSDIVAQWEKTWQLRYDLLAPVKKSGGESILLKDYFKSFPCVRPLVTGLELVRILIIFLSNSISRDLEWLFNITVILI